MKGRSNSDSRRALLGVALLSCALLVQCREPTQVMLQVTTDAQCVDVRGTSITVGGSGRIEGKAPAARTEVCSPTGRVGSIAIVPSGDKDDEVAIRVVTGVGKSPEACVTDGYLGGCIVARRVLRFLPHTPLDLPVHMGIDCLDIPCGATETCFKGQCVPAKIDCSESGGCQPLPGDGGAPDAAVDASTDQEAGAGGVGGSGGATGGTSGGAGQDAAAGSGGTDAGDAAPDALSCTSPQADCNNSVADGCETDLDTDPLHCGLCGRDCQGGSCNLGLCTPVTLWTEANATPTRLALDATHVYFVDFNGGNVRRIAKTGGSVELLAAAQNATRIAVDSTHAYFTNDQKSQVVRVPKTGGATELLATLPQAATSIALDATHVYVSETSNTGRIQKLLKTGGAPTILANTPWPIGIAVTSAHVYWPSFENNGTLRRVPIGGGTTETLDTNTDNGFAVAVDSANVYWTVLGTGANKGEIRKLPLAGGTMEVLAAAQKGPRGIAVDATHVYWTNSDGGTVHRIAVDGSGAGVPTVIASGGVEPLGIAVDSTSVYWADDKANVLRRVTK